MNCAIKGRRAEHRARHLLESSGFTVCRAAGSRGLVDLVAWDSVSLRFISVKSGTRYCSALEREGLQLMPRPACSSIEVWRWPHRARSPLIETL
jgi:Holliday junction resolvase